MIRYLVVEFVVVEFVVVALATESISLLSNKTPTKCITMKRDRGP